MQCMVSLWMETFFGGWSLPLKQWYESYQQLIRRKELHCTEFIGIYIFFSGSSLFNKLEEAFAPVYLWHLNHKCRIPRSNWWQRRNPGKKKKKKKKEFLLFLQEMIRIKIISFFSVWMKVLLGNKFPSCLFYLACNDLAICFVSYVF